MYRIIVSVIFISLVNCAVDFSDRSRNFSIVLVHHTAAQTDGHVVISPFGIWTLLTGVALGATGESYEQLRKAFILPKNEKALIKGYKNLTQIVLEPVTKEVSITSKNYMFLDQNFALFQDFRRSMTDDFGAVIKVLNFNDPNLAARTANNYIVNSGGRVTNVLTSEDFAESRMILTNVISFKGLWKLPFNKTDTNLEPFYNEEGTPIGKVNMMYQRGQFAFSNMKSLKAFALEIPYGNDGRYSMLILLPHTSTNIMNMYKNFASVTLKDIFKQLEEDEKEFGLEDIDVKVPRFKISTNVVLNRPLNDMGVYDIFDPELANFGRVSNEKLFVSAIVHKADIEVTEAGTVASAATTAYFADRITPPKIYANRPFVYFIIEKSTTTVIFGGIYSKPTAY